MDAMATREVTDKKVVTIGSFAWAPVAGKKLKEISETLGWDVKGSIVMKQALSDETLAQIRAAAKELAASL